MSYLTGKYHYVFFAIMALLSWWLVKLTVTDMLSHSDSKVHSVDYFSVGYTKWEMANTGELKSKLSAATMQHYKDDSTIHLVKPIMAFYNATTPPWIVSSDTGMLSADGKNLQLKGKAVVDRAKAPNISPLTINTTNLNVKPEISYAETSDWAELISRPNRTEGVGMKLTYIEPIRVELLAKVRGHYETKQ